MIDGYKTYIIGAVLIIKGAAGIIFPDSGVSDNPAQDIEMGLLAVGFRSAMAKK